MDNCKCKYTLHICDNCYYNALAKAKKKIDEEVNNEANR